MPEWLRYLLELTAHEMKQPPMFGGFHIGAAVLAVLIPYALARKFPPGSRAQAVRRLSVCGWILVLMEIYKQLFLYVIVNDMQYNFWYFPFQLCSIAMYLCILLPVLSRAAQNTVLTFLFDFSLPGALLALVFPEDFLRTYVSLTLHGFIWHGMLVYIALTVWYIGLFRHSWQAYFRAAGLYLVLAGCAIGLNVLFQPYAEPGAQPNLFYLSPYMKTGQFFFRDIAERFGILPEMVIYVSLYLLLAAAFHALARIRLSGSE